MVTHPAHGATSGTLVNARARARDGALPGDALRPGLVHRLDRDTSGLLVVAKNEESLRELGAAMKDATHRARISRARLRRPANTRAARSKDRSDAIRATA